MLKTIHTAITPPLAAMFSGIASLITACTPSDIAAYCGALSATIGGAYAAWKWLCEWEDRRRLKGKK